MEGFISKITGNISFLKKNVRKLQILQGIPYLITSLVWWENRSPLIVTM